MTYRELYESAINKLEKSEITLGEFERMIKPLNAEVGGDSDTISRAKAIDALNKLSESTYEVDYGVVDCDDAIAEIKQLPPIQPEIVRCKDCGYRDEFGCCKYWVGLTMGMPTTATDDEDFCSYAKRREVTE